MCRFNHPTLSILRILRSLGILRSLSMALHVRVVFLCQLQHSGFTHEMEHLHTKRTCIEISVLFDWLRFTSSTCYYCYVYEFDCGREFHLWYRWRESKRMVRYLTHNTKLTPNTHVCTHTCRSAHTSTRTYSTHFSNYSFNRTKVYVRMYARTSTPMHKTHDTHNNTQKYIKKINIKKNHLKYHLKSQTHHKKTSLTQKHSRNTGSVISVTNLMFLYCFV